jgi:prepilin-type N-terminal cleavage/methylation domain-containing protein
MVSRSGFTLVEVVVALVILMTVMLQLVVMTGQTTNTTATSERQEAAMELALDQIDHIRSDPNWAGLSTTYVGSQGGFATLPGVTRTTTMVQDSTATTNYKVFTVTLTGPGLSTAVALTTIVAAP